MRRKIDVKSRLQFWGILSRGIGNYRYSMWRPSKSAATHMEALHNKILQRIIGAHPLSDDTAESFCRRRNRLTADLRERANLTISKQWSLALIRWVEHVRRHGDTPVARLLNVQSDLWLDTMRALRWTVSSSSFAGMLGPGTRSGPGKPIRWSEQWLDAVESALGLDNEERYAAVTRERAQMVQGILERARLHGVPMCG